MTTEELLDLQEEIEEAVKEMATLEGKKQYMMEELKKTWKCDTVEQAETKLTKMDEAIEKLNEDIDNKTTALEEQLDGQNTDTQD